MSGGHRILALGGVVFVALAGWLCPARAVEPVAPAAPSGAIGRPAAGCLAGGAALPRRGDGFERIRPKTVSHTGHPHLVALITELGRVASAEKLGRLHIGDLGLPRGGPLPRGHASHQNGLDADIAYGLGRQEGRAALVPMVDHRRGRPRRAFGAAQRRLLELTARDPRVARIFVHPVLKRALCAEVGPDEDARAWHRKLRPWWGHDRHFHVRLACPADSALCEDQAPLPEGDGCADLDWWFQPHAQADRDKAAGEYQKKVGARPALPEACRAVLGLAETVAPGR
jgi:penicillin-insensitive murein endopeptidase